MTHHYVRLQCRFRRRAISKASYNAITVVENGALRASTKLSALILSNNELTAVPSPLQYLHNLRQLGLSGNSIAELPARLHFKKLVRACAKHFSLVLLDI